MQQNADKGDNDEKVECAGRPSLCSNTWKCVCISGLRERKNLSGGIYAGDFALGGLTKEEAEEKFASYVSALEERSITLDVVGNKVETTAKDLGYACANTDALQEAEEYAAGGCLIRQYMERKDLEKEPVHISLEAGVDETVVQAFVEEQCSGLPGEPQDAAITRVNGKFEITPEQSGMAVDVKATIDALNKALEKENGAAVSVDAVISEQQPKIKKQIWSLFPMCWVPVPRPMPAAGHPVPAISRMAYPRSMAMC